MKRLIITEEERSRILGMHQNAISRQYLMEVEKAYEVIPITFYIPMKRDVNNELVMDTRGVVKYVAKNITEKGNPKGSLDDYSKFQVIGFIGANTNMPVSSMKQGKDIVGSFTLTQDKKNLINYLASQKGKSDPKGFNEEINLRVITVDNKTIGITGGPTYTTYEVQPTQPKTN